jgi:hypothetical protein
MVVNGVAKVTDPKGNVRYSVSKLKTRIGFLPTGALLTLAATADELQVAPGGRLAIPLSISRAQRLQEPATLELVVGPKLQGLLSAEPATVQKSQNEAVFPIAVAADSGLAGEFPITVRATVLQDGKYPVVSEATILVTISSDSPVK